MMFATFLQVVYQCTAEGCREASEAKSGSGNMLVISHTLQTVRAVDVGSGAEKYVFVFSLHYIVDWFC
jgi:hypothetical protein